MQLLDIKYDICVKSIMVVRSSGSLSQSGVLFRYRLLNFIIDRECKECFEQEYILNFGYIILIVKGKIDYKKTGCQIFISD